ncbi:26S proteasome non-ATPase regulatory subunit 9 [Cryptococcus deuterogattii CA1014]|nr:26S proteasome non-ATPase regulatory subunit 9 [Cryptococcus deuterogattii CA1014]
MPQELAFPPPEEPSILSLPLPHPDAYPGEPREYALALIQRKDAIQKEIASLPYPAPAKRNANPSRMSSTTYYPQQRRLSSRRSGHFRLQNDRRTVTDLLATALHDAFAPSSPSSEQQPNGNVSVPSSQTNGYSARTRQTVWPERAVAKVNTVAENSPASVAGLKAQDMIYSFAGIDHTSPGGLQAIGAAVAQSEGGKSVYS